ncbi:hypothetical protein ABPG75_000935 [Micractinium tetrahymenae]
MRSNIEQRLASTQCPFVSFCTWFLLLGWPAHLLARAGFVPYTSSTHFMLCVTCMYVNFTLARYSAAGLHSDLVVGAAASLLFGAWALYNVSSDVAQRGEDAAELRRWQESADQLLGSPLAAVAQTAASRLQRAAGKAERAHRQARANLRRVRKCLRTWQRLKWGWRQ